MHMFKRVPPIKQEDVEKILAILFIVLLCIVGLRLKLSRRETFQSHIDMLTSISGDTVQVLTIFPRGDGLPIDFKRQDPLLDNFFRALQDSLPYKPNHDRVLSWEFNWIVEFVNHETNMRIPFYIPLDTKEIAVGEIVRVTKGGSFHYGHFQSSQLYQWYQKYSHRWLKPEAPQ